MLWGARRGGITEPGGGGGPRCVAISACGRGCEAAASCGSKGGVQKPQDTQEPGLWTFQFHNSDNIVLFAIDLSTFTFLFKSTNQRPS